VNLGTARIVIILALIVGGVVVLANGFGSATRVTPGIPGSGGGSGASSSPSRHPPHKPNPAPSPQVQGVRVAVFNGTFAPGLATQVLQKLTGDGYAQAQAPADAPSKVVAKTVVYYLGGSSGTQNRVDAKYIARKYFSGARVAVLGANLTGLVSKNAQVAIVIGSDYKPTA
jgi:hypothetical protein